MTRTIPPVQKGNWREIGTAKRLQRDLLIPDAYLLRPDYLRSVENARDVIHTVHECGLLSSQEAAIVNSDTEVILGNLLNRKWSAVEVTTAFCKSAAVAQQMTNCLTEIFFEEALRTAKALDDYYEKSGHPKGPLHGLPISIKDNFKIAGYASTVGFTAWAHEIMTTDSELIQILKERGAVLYVKTNVPVAMMMAESMNHVFGVTTNPHNRLLSAGGSSGGEAALISMRGSPLGVGTDIGGSIRIPAAFNNLYSLRPSFGRFPTYGARSAMPGQEAVNSVNGPLANSVGGLKVYSKNIVDAEPWLRDPKMLPIPWRHVTLPKKLVFGVIWNNGMARPHPPVARGLKLAVEAVRRAGHEVIDWEPIYHFELNRILERMFLADGGTHISEVIAQTEEPFFPYMKPYHEAYIANSDLPTSQMWKLHSERTELCKKYLDYWNSSAERTSTGRPIDAILSPVTTFAANENGKFKHVAYTGVWNVLDYSAATFPVTAADKDVDVMPCDYEPLGPLDADISALYDPEVYDGGPVAIQLVARKLEEEKLLEMLDAIKMCL